jgi:predicted GNAT family N-acyltransferase
VLQIEQITPRLTYKLRRDVLYPDKQAAEMEMAEDENGVHFGGFKDNKLIAVVSLFQKATDFQFRKLAVDPSMQKMGIGNAMLKYIEAYAQQNQGTSIWCNARISAIGFYLKANYRQTGDLFTRDGIDFLILEKVIIPVN